MKALLEATTLQPPSSHFDLDTFFVVLPALNEGDRIAGVINKLRNFGFKNIVVVNDGSTDHTSDVIPNVTGVYELKHIVNLGPGASTMTGIRFALLKNAAYIATIDADHQSDPKDLIDLMKAMETDDQVDLLIGSRFLQKNTIPVSRRLYNKVGNIISYLVTGLYVTDSQSGFKIMTRRFAEKLQIDYNGFEFCIDIIKKAHMHKFKVAEAPVSVVYTKETLAKGQSFKEGLLMLGRLFNPFT
jgi:glycosyltransferase involved in cell wall biosynthesis